MTTTELDQETAEAFAGRMAGVINDAALTLSMSIGHRTGLFDSLAGLPPSTSEQIANAFRPLRRAASLGGQPHIHLARPRAIAEVEALLDQSLKRPADLLLDH